VTENLTKRFVDHRGIGLAPQRVPELALNPAERGFNVARLLPDRLLIGIVGDAGLKQRIA
jgi:hypothetical protein